VVTLLLSSRFYVLGLIDKKAAQAQYFYQSTQILNQTHALLCWRCL